MLAPEPSVNTPECPGSRTFRSIPGGEPSERFPEVESAMSDHRETYSPTRQWDGPACCRQATCGQTDERAETWCPGPLEPTQLACPALAPVAQLDRARHS